MGLSGTSSREWPKEQATLAARVSVTGREGTAKRMEEMHASE